MGNHLIRILLVEDNPGDALLVEEALAEVGPGRFEVTRADRMSTALAGLDAGGVDLVLLDLSLPDAQGLESFHGLRARSPLVPIVVLSGTSDEGLALEAVNAGAQDYLVKGRFQGDSLARAARYALGRSRGEAALRQSEAAMRAFQDASPMMIGVVELVEDDILFVSANASTADCLGLPKEALQGRVAGRLGHPRGQAAGWAGRFLDRPVAGLPVRREYLEETPHGPRWYSWTICQLPVTPQERARFSFIAEDVTDRKGAEEALRFSEERYARAVRGSTDGLWDWLCETENVYYAPRFKSLLGFEDHEFPNLIASWASRLHPDDKERILDALSAHCESRVPYDVEYRLLTKSEEYRWFHARGEAEWDEDSRPTRMAGSISDVTTRVLAEQALLATERRFRAVFDQTFQLGGLLSPDGTLLEANDVALRFGGVAREDVIGKPFWETPWWETTPEDRERLRSAIGEAGQGRTVSYEVEVRGEGGALACIDFSLRPVRDESGAVVLLVPEGRDISERKRAETEQARLVAILDATTDFVGIADLNAKAVFLNRGGRLMVGRREDDVPGSAVANYHPAWAIELMKNEAVPTALREGSWSGELAILGTEGREVPVSAVIIALINSQGDPEHLACVCRDITDQKRAEREILALNGQLSRRLEHLSALRSIDAAINSSFDLGRTLEVVLSEVFSQLQPGAAAVWLRESDSPSLTCATHRGFAGPAMTRSPLRFDDSVVGRVALDARPMVLSDLSRSPWPFVRAEAVAEEGFRSYSAAPLVSKGECLGVLEVFGRDPIAPEPEWVDFLTALADQAAIAVENFTLFESMQRSNDELTLAYDATIHGWSRALDLRDKETEGHSQRVTEMTLRLARVFGCGDDELAMIGRGALLHDIGKMGVPDSILLKPGPLTDDEWAVMRRHPAHAYEWLSPIEFLRPALEIPYCHHEKWDGSGYPRGLSGESIPMAARMFAAVDVCDALLSDRPYRKGWPVEKVREHIQSLSGTHLDPRVVEAFLPLIGAPEAAATPAMLRLDGVAAVPPDPNGRPFGARTDGTEESVVPLDGLVLRSRRAR